MLTHIVVWCRQLYFCSSFMGFRIPQLIKSTVMVPTPFQYLKVETLRNRFRVYKYNVMMNRNILFILLLCLCFCSCQKKYRYVEIVNERDILSGETSRKEKEPELIEASDDSVAYCAAYQKFCIAQKVARDMKKTGMDLGEEPLEFKLLDEQNVNIANKNIFVSKDKIEEEISERIFSLENSVKNTGSIKETQKSFSVDKSKVDELLKDFVRNRDEFDGSGLVWYTPKHAPKHVDRNGIYLYFGKDDNSIKPLRLRVQYYADEWLFISNVIFNIDGKVFRFIPTKVERDSGNGGMIWEWIDEPIQDESDKELIYALVNAKSAKMKFNGSQYYKIKAISNAQLTSMRKTLELFNALGGNF